MIIALTGHQPPRLNSRELLIYNWIESTLQIFAEGQDGNISCICGGAAGADELFAKACMKKGVPFDLYLPIESYRGKELARYKRNCRKVVAAAGEWQKGLDTKRDKMMVDNCDVLFAVWDGKPVGGAYETIQYAKKKGKMIIYLPQSIFNRRKEYDSYVFG